jgi:hypothetical protein
MTAAPWTPGPWLIVTPTQGYEVCTIHGVERQPTEDGLGQAWVYIRPETLLRDGEWYWPDEQEQLANAHLIAAAPDMAEVLDEVSGFAHQTARDRDLSDAELAFMRRVDAALAKARGQA